MKHDELIAQLRRELENERKSLAFWEAQPDHDVRGFNIMNYRERLRGMIAENERALAILAAENDA